MRTPGGRCTRLRDGCGSATGAFWGPIHPLCTLSLVGPKPSVRGGGNREFCWPSPAQACCDPSTAQSHLPLHRLCSAFPNRHFWYEFDALVLDGLRFLVRGCKKGPRGSKLTESSAEATPFTNASSSSGSGSGAASASGSGAAEGRSAYQTIGAASEGPAYADL